MVGRDQGGVVSLEASKQGGATQSKAVCVCAVAGASDFSHRLDHRLLQQGQETVKGEEQLTAAMVVSEARSGLVADWQGGGGCRRGTEKNERRRRSMGEEATASGRWAEDGSGIKRMAARE